MGFGIAGPGGKLLELAAGFSAVRLPLSARAWPGPACGTRNRGSSKETGIEAKSPPVTSIACNEEACSCHHKKYPPAEPIWESFEVRCWCCRARPTALAVHSWQSVRHGRTCFQQLRIS